MLPAKLTKVSCSETERWRRAGDQNKLNWVGSASNRSRYNSLAMPMPMPKSMSMGQETGLSLLSNTR